MRETKSVRSRLIIGTLVVSAIIALTTGLLLGDSFRDRVDDPLEAELEQLLDRMDECISARVQGEFCQGRGQDRRLAATNSGFFAQINTAEGPIWRSPSLGDAALTVDRTFGAFDGTDEWDDIGPGNRPLRFMTRYRVNGTNGLPLLLIAAGDRSQVDESIALFSRTLWISRILLVGVMVLVGLWMIEIVLRPLRHMGRELAEVRAGQRARLSEQAPTEIEPIVRDLNNLLDFVDAAAQRSQLQAGQFAHTLRTHLAVLANDIATLEPGNATQVAQRLRDRVDLLREQAEQQLSRTRVSPPDPVRDVSVEVLAAVGRIAHALTRLQQDRHVEIDFDLTPDLMFRGRGGDLDDILGNVMDNACKWARRRVEVSATAGPAGWFDLAIDDDGPGLPDGAEATAAVPGVRFDPSTPGTGLGLAIVRDLVGVYGGSMTLCPSALGGLRVVLRLPGELPAPVDGQPLTR